MLARLQEVLAQVPPGERGRVRISVGSSGITVYGGGRVGQHVEAGGSARWSPTGGLQGSGEVVIKWEP